MIHIEKISFPKKAHHSLILEKKIQNALNKIMRSKARFLLFAGDDSRAKMAALEFLVNADSLITYRIDLSQVVSKYVGETEKNLSRLFERVEKQGCILFFDEADALFGNRSEVKDAQERYAELTVFFLNHLKTFDGMVIVSQHRNRGPAKEIQNKFNAILHFPLPK